MLFGCVIAILFETNMVLKSFVYSLFFGIQGKLATFLHNKPSSVLPNTHLSYNFKCKL